MVPGSWAPSDAGAEGCRHGAGVPVTIIPLAMRHGELTANRDEGGYEWGDPEEVAALDVPR
jgi:hypothetical protein